MSIIDQMLTKYEINSNEDMRNAMREIYQEIALLGIYSGGFFEKAVFYGGTCLRIFHNLPRFSEDLDFSLLQRDENFDIEKYFKCIINEFEAFGISATIRKKDKKDKISSIETAILNVLANNFQKTIKIKIEVDKNPPLNFVAEPKTLLMPKSFNVSAMTLPNLYASKLHAVLFRSWKTRVKGRDWFDFEWYVKNNIPLNLEHLQHRIRHFGNLSQEYIAENDIKDLLLKKIDEIDLAQAINDVKIFTKHHEELTIWSKDYFKFLVSKICYQQKQDFSHHTPKHRRR